MSARKQARKAGALFHDPWRKLVALVLAVLLWLFLDSQVTQHKEVTCVLRPADSSASSFSDVVTSSPVIAVRFPTTQFSLLRFHEPGKPQIEQLTVKLKLSGSNRIMGELPHTEVFVVDLDPVNEPRRGYEFDVNSLRCPRVPELASTLAEMDPPRIVVQLERNQNHSVVLTPQQVEFETPRAEDLARLDTGSIRFEPKSVRLRGRQEAIARLGTGGKPFRVVLEETRRASARRELTGTLELGAEAGDSLHIVGEPVSVTVFVRPEFTRYEYEVPVFLDTSLTPYATGDFEPVPDHLVEFKLIGDLRTELEAKDREEERAAWVRENWRIYVQLLPGTELTGVPQLRTKLFYVPNWTWREGIDYEYDMFPVTVRPKKRDASKPNGKGPQ